MGMALGMLAMVVCHQTWNSVRRHYLQIHYDGRKIMKALLTYGTITACLTIARDLALPIEVLISTSATVLGDFCLVALLTPAERQTLLEISRRSIPARTDSLVARIMGCQVLEMKKVGHMISEDRLRYRFRLPKWEGIIFHSLRLSKKACLPLHRWMVRKLYRTLEINVVARKA